MKAKTLSVLAGVSAPLILSGSTDAGFVGIKTTSKPNDFGIFVVNVYVTFDRPGEDLMMAVAGTSFRPLVVCCVGERFAPGQGWGQMLPSRIREGRDPITEKSITWTLHDHLDKIGLENVTPHDLRRTAASGMTALGHTRFVVDRVLNHADRSVGAIYDRHTYLPEKMSALRDWGRHLSDLVSGEAEKRKVVPLPVGA